MITTPFPTSLCLGAFYRGGDRKRLFGSFTVTYSLNMILSCVLLTGTCVCPMTGYISVMTGGMVSFGPPVGGVVVFAHECENMAIPRIIDTGIIGKNLLRNFFIYTLFIGQS